jgi:excisionase family DNA binding protein
MNASYGTIPVMAGEYMTTGEIAAELGVTATTVREWHRLGYIEPALKTAGGHLRWRLDDVRRQLTEREQSERDS